MRLPATPSRWSRPRSPRSRAISSDSHAEPPVTPSPLSGLARALNKLNIFALWRRVDNVADALQGHQEATDRRFDQADAVERRMDAAEESFRGLQGEIEHLRDERAAAIERRLDGFGDELGATAKRLDGVEHGLRQADGEAERLRDRVVPAAVRRTDALVERLAAEIDEVASLVERMLRHEPLPTSPLSMAQEQELATALNDVQPALVEAFRGSEEEIHHRMERYLEVLRGSAPVLDLGSGRGELLLMLREAGVEAAGVEGDAALAQAARRRGLQVIEGDVLEVLSSEPDATRGAVTAFHLLEHLPPAPLARVLAEAHRVLRPGGFLIVESPNPSSLRVAASLHWLDPTHQHPLHAETLQVFLKAAGFEVEKVEFLHPFPEEQLFSAMPRDDMEIPESLRHTHGRLDLLCRRLDDLLNGDRDFAIRAVKPE